MNHLFRLKREPNKIIVTYNGVVVGYVSMRPGDPYARATATPLLKSQPWWPKLRINMGQVLIGIASLSDLPGTVVIEN